MAGQIVRIWGGYGTQAAVERYCHEHRDETEVVVATTWDSIESLKAFAGDDYEKAVVEPVVRELLNRFDDRVAHFAVALAAAQASA